MGASGALGGAGAMAGAGRRFAFLLPVAVLAATAGCGTSRFYFRPTENLVRPLESGRRAVARYDFADAAGRTLAVLRVASQGIHEAKVMAGEGEVPVLQMDVSLTNLSPTAMTVTPRMQAVSGLDGLGPLEPFHAYSNGLEVTAGEVRAGVTRNFTLLYLAGKNVDLDAICGGRGRERRSPRLRGR